MPRDHSQEFQVQPDFGPHLLPAIRERLNKPRLRLSTVKRFATAPWGSKLQRKYPDQCITVWRAWMAAKGHLNYTGVR